MLAQASRRVKRNEEDQALIHALRNKLERAQDMAECKSNELANFYEGAQDMRRMQAVYRARRVQQVNQMPPPVDTGRRSHESAMLMRSHSFSSPSTRRKKTHSRSESRTGAIATSTRTRESWTPSGRATSNFANSWTRRPRSPSGCFAIATSPLRTSRRQSRESDAREPSFQTERAPSPG